MRMILVDGKVTEEKLRELLDWGAECTELDFKEVIDFSSKLNELKFVKDAVAMLNHYPGGYLVVGVTDDAKPSERSKGMDWRQLDGDVLTKKVRKYVDGLPEIVSQTYEIDGHKYCVICMKSPEDGLLMPFNKNGQSGGEFVFHEGEITRRDGAGNGCIRYNQWNDILAQRDRAVRLEERKRIDALIEKISEAIARTGKTPPLEIGLSDAALMTSLSSCFEHEDYNKLMRFAEKLGSALSRGEDVFVELASLAAHAAMYKRDDVFTAAVDALYEYYDGLDHSKSGHYEKKLRIATALYEIGSAAVRTRSWALISPLVNRQSLFIPDYPYASWLRECQVEASRAGLFKEDRFGMMISAALSDMRSHPALRPDVDEAEDPEDESAEWDAINENMLDSLCCFDFLYCVCVYAEGKGHGEAYPACIAFDETRVARLIARLLGQDDSMRRELLPNVDDCDLAKAIKALWDVISHQSFESGQWSWRFERTGAVERFLSDNLDQQNA